MNRQSIVAAWTLPLVATASLVVAAQAPRFRPVTDETLRSPAPADWPAWRRDRAGTGYSPLDQINRSNVRRLHLAWASTLEMWMTGSYDPDLKLVYWTTGSAFPYTELAKGTPGSSNLYTQSILALKAETGEIAWYKQLVPRDNFDLDHADNPILADVMIRGARRQVVYTMGKPSVLWAFDRRTGEHLLHRLVVPYQNIYKQIDEKSGAITMNEEIIPKAVNTFQVVCPGMRGGKIFQAKAFNPRADAVYSAVSLACSR